jgi:hypothetical protein
MKKIIILIAAIAIVILTIAPVAQAGRCMELSLLIPDSCTAPIKSIPSFLESGTEGFRDTISFLLGQASMIRSDDQYVGCEGTHIQIRPTEAEDCEGGHM